MHELAVAQGMVDVLADEMQRHQLTRLRSVRIRIGQLTCVLPSALTLAFGMLSQGTALEGASLEVERVAPTGYCSRCDREFALDDLVFVCGRCHNPDIRVIAGRELSIVEIDAE